MKKKEKWKGVDGIEGYEVSNEGRVRSYINNRHGVGENYHILKPTLNKHGYETVCLGRGKRKLVHRIVANAFIPNPNNYPIVRHKDDNPRNNNTNNLSWGTQKDNMQDCVNHGRLTGDTKAAIDAKKISVRAFDKNGKYLRDYDSMHDAARDLNLWPQHVANVVNGKIKQTGGYKFKRLEDCSNGIECD